MSTPFEVIECLQGNTLRDPLTGQPMHSAIGPTQEAKLIYLGPSRLEARLAEPGPPLVLWDVGMGIAANATEALLIRGVRPLEVHSFENDLDGLGTALGSEANFAHLAALGDAPRRLLERDKATVGPHTWYLHRGDFTQAFVNGPPADVIFYDFYSPRTCGSLWSVPVMQAVRARSPRSTLVTYSAATPVRLALLLAGWWVGNPGDSGPVTALKNESTVAVASEEELRWLGAPLGSRWLQKFRSSTQAKPYEGGSWSQASFEEIEAELLRHPQFAEAQE